MLKNVNTSTFVRLNASKVVLNYSLKIREQTEIIEKLENIKKRIDYDR